MQPPRFFFALHKNAKATDPGHLSNLFSFAVILVKKMGGGGTPKEGGRVSRQSSGVWGEGLLQPREILSRHFEKYTHAM